MSKKDIIVIVLKVIMYAITLLLGAVGVTAALSGCSYSRNTATDGKGSLIIHYHDTTTVYHGSRLYYPKVK